MKQLLEYRAELLARLERQPAELAGAVNVVPEGEWTARRVSDGYTLHQLAAHVRDLEALAFLPRLRRILTEDYPALDAFPSHHWSAESYRPDEPMTDILAGFTRAREEALARLHSLPAEGWGRTGFHPPSGPRTAQWWAERMYTHVQEHVDEIRRGLKTVSR
jgi:DinB family protein